MGGFESPYFSFGLFACGEFEFFGCGAVLLWCGWVLPNVGGHGLGIVLLGGAGGLLAG